jgi:hypothetical protein
MYDPGGMAPGAGIAAGGAVLSTTVPVEPGVHPGVAGVAEDGAAVVVVEVGGAKSVGLTWLPAPAHAATARAITSARAARRLIGTR